MKHKIPSQTLILVCDGRKALFLRNVGDADYPNLQVEQILTGKDNPATAKQGADRPGRVHDSASGRRGSVEQTDWHSLEEQHFAREIAAALQQQEQAGSVASLMVVAPPRTLAELRDSFSEKLREKIIGEISKDLTNHPVHRIEELLTAE